MKKKHGKIHHYIDFMQNMQIYAQNMHKHCSVVKKYANIRKQDMHKKHKIAFDVQ